MSDRKTGSNTSNAPRETSMDDVRMALRDVVEECRTPHVNPANALRQVGERVKRILDFLQENQVAMAMEASGLTRHQERLVYVVRNGPNVFVETTRPRDGGTVVVPADRPTLRENSAVGMDREVDLLLSDLTTFGNDRVAIAGLSEDMRRKIVAGTSAWDAAMEHIRIALNETPPNTTKGPNR